MTTLVFPSRFSQITRLLSRYLFPAAVDARSDNQSARAAGFSHDAILLYFFLAAVSDKDGLSFYADSTIAVRLRIGERAVVAAREELVTEDLVAYRAR